MIRINRKIEVSALQFCIFYPAFIYTISNVLNLPKFLKWFYFKGNTDFSALISFFIIGLCLFIFLFTLLAHRKTIKPVAIVFALLSAPSAYFIYKYGIAIDRSMLMNVINTNSTEVSDLLSVRMIPYMLVLMALPIGLTLITRIRFSDSGHYLVSSVKLIAGSLSLAVGLVYLQFNGISRAVNSSNKYVIQTLIPINYLQSFGSLAQHSIEDYLRLHGKKVEFSGRVTSTDNLVVVLAVGESSRQQSFSLYGYRRQNTNPLLSKEKNLHVLNGIAKQGSTLYALPEIFVKDDVPLPLATKSLGIETACYVNYTLYDICDAVGEIPVSNCKYKTCYDEDVIPLLSNNLKSYRSGYRFVVLHLGGGSHGPTYDLRVPPDFQKFTPTCKDPDVVSRCTQDELYNSYDNTIAYVDSVVSQIIGELDRSKVPYVFMYMSDHGESLLEDGRIFHGMPLGIKLPPEQARVPLLVKSSIPISVAKREEYLQTEVFDTVASLFSIESKITDEKLSFITKGQWK